MTAVSTAAHDEREPARTPAVPAAASKGAVCMVAYAFYAFDARVRREAETLAADGFHVRCLTTRVGESPRSYVLNGVDVQEVNVPKYRGKSRIAYLFSYLWFLVATSIVCLRLLGRRRLDIVHAHNLPDFLVFAGLIPRLMGCKVVLDIHDSIPETFATKFSRTAILWNVLCWEERLSALMAHKVICVNEPQRDTLVSRGIPREKTLIAMNVPDERIFARGDRSQPANEGYFNLVYHGTMSERLGVDLIIRAAAQAGRQIPGLKLHLWGTGDDSLRFQALSSDLGLQDVVQFNPRGYELEELPQHLCAMQVGIVGNRRTMAGELMLPVKLLEYVAMDIAAIVPRLHTIAHYFDDDMVTYYEPENVDSLALAISRLYSCPDVRRAQVQRARAFMDRYAWDRHRAELIETYRALWESRAK